MIYLGVQGPGQPQRRSEKPRLLFESNLVGGYVNVFVKRIRNSYTRKEIHPTFSITSLSSPSRPYFSFLERM
jgi:hypothetical protein